VIYQNLELHNITEIQEGAALGMTAIYRVPRSVRNALGARGRFISEEGTGAEIRFVTDAPHVRITLCAPETAGHITVFKGGNLHSQHRLEAGHVHTLHLEAPPLLQEVGRGRLLQSGFAPEVWRIGIGRHTVLFGGVQTFGKPLRPPAPGETPPLRWLAYGSSITHGLTAYPSSYIHQAARRLAADVYNLGLSGSCHCEPEMGDFLASRSDWDIATLELGVNMRGGFTVEQFQERTSYLINTIVDRHPDKPVFLITMFPNSATYAENEIAHKARAFNEVLRGHVRRLDRSTVQLIEGDAILTDMSGLSCDMLHPGEYGHMLMGENLARCLKAKTDT
jgi:lysophospholipase L1-like esterase